MTKQLGTWHCTTPANIKYSPYVVYKFVLGVFGAKLRRRGFGNPAPEVSESL